MSDLRHQIFVDRLLAVAILVLLGALNIALTPAWTNPEEPYHFIRIRQMADRSISEADLSETIAASVVVSHSEIGLLGQVNDAHTRQAQLTTDSAWAALRTKLTQKAGYSPVTLESLSQPQDSELPLYYLYQLPLQFVLNGAPVSIQLMGARFGSLVLGLLTVLLVGEIAAEALPDLHVVRRALPLIVTLQPQFIGTMTQVNNTVMAVFAITAALWAALPVLRHGVNPRRLIMLLIAALLCAFAKTTAWAGGVLILLALLAASPKPIKVAAIALCVIGMVGGVALLHRSGAVSWYPYRGAAQVQIAAAPQGTQVLAIPSDGGVWQNVPPSVTQALRGKDVHLSVTMRTDGVASSAIVPMLWAAPLDGTFQPIQTNPGGVALTSEWTDLSITATVPNDTFCLSVWLLPHSTSGVQYDALTLREDSKPDRNLVANGSFETAWWLFPDWLDSVSDTSVFGRELNLNHRLALLLDYPTNTPFHLISLRYLFSTFWGYIGWGEPALTKPIIAGLALLTLISAIGIMATLRRTASERWLWITICAACAVGLALALLTLEPPTLQFTCTLYQGRVMPTAYYLAPLIVLALLIWFRGLASWRIPSERWMAGTLLLAFFCLWVMRLLALISVTTRLFGL